MDNIVDIKRKIKSIKNISQTTKAMELISSAKMRQANVNYLNNIRYMSKVRKTLKDILIHLGEVEHKYLKHRITNRASFVVISSDSGMAGEYNNRVLDYAFKYINEYEGIKTIYTIGKVATDFFSKKGMHPEIDFLTYGKNFRLRHARNITQRLVYEYDINNIDEIIIIYTQHLENQENEVKSRRILPILVEDFSDIVFEDNDTQELDFEPNPKIVFDILAPQYILGLIYSAMVQSVKCEHEERMEAMHNAYKSAKEMLDDLEVSFHRARQEQITKELIELS